MKELYGAVADGVVSAQVLNVELTQEFFEAVINNLQARLGDGRDTARRFIQGRQRQQEAAREFTRGAVESYMEFLNSMFSYYQGGMEWVRRRAGPPRVRPFSRARKGGILRPEEWRGVES